MRLTALSREQNIQITTRDVFENSTLDALAKVVENRSASDVQVIASDTNFLDKKDLALWHELRRQCGAPSDFIYVNQRAAIQEHKNSTDILANDLQTRPTRSNAIEIAGNKNHTVVLTGSSGALGSHLLEAFLKAPSTCHVYCLDRAPGSSSTQSQRNRSHNEKLANKYPSNRVTFLTAEISQQNFRLECKTYESLLNQATAVIHSAWPVNFNLPLSAFGPQLVGITRLAEFAVSAAHSPVILFVSSIGSMLGYRGSSPSIREEIVLDTKASSSMGYEESKYLAELLLDYASKKLFIDARIARVGQIAGPVKGQGIWNEWERLPSLVLSSLHIGTLPDSLGPSQNKIDWVPVDLLAEVLVELTLKIDRQEAPTLIQPEKIGKERVFHPLNPHPVAWKSLLPTIVNTPSQSNTGTKKIDIVPFQVWLDKVRADAEAAGSADVKAMLRVNPAAKLLGVYEKFAEGGKNLQFETWKTEEASEKMRAIGEIKPEWIELD